MSQGPNVAPDRSLPGIDRRIRELERRHDLLQYQAGGWCLWPVLRFPVQSALRLGASGGLQARSRWDRVRPALDDLPRLVRAGGARYLVKTYISGLLERSGDSYKDIWFDDLLGAVGGGFKIVGINSPGFMARSRSSLVPPDMSSTAIELAVSALIRLPGPSQLLGPAENIAVALAGEFGQATFPLRWVIRRLRAFHWYARLYGQLLERVIPDVVLVADPGEYGLVAAAKERQIPVVELQHGMMDAHHSGYSWTDYASPFRARMPIPDALFLYGEQACRALEGNGFWGEALRNVGSPRVDDYRERRRTAPSSTEECVLVVTTQGTESGAIINLLSRFVKIARGALRFRLLVKLHPIYDTGSLAAYRAAFTAQPEVEVLAGTAEVSTFALLAKASLHVSISSSCHYDALALGVPTAVLPFATHEVVLPLVAAGHAHLAPDAETLLELAQGWRELRPSEAIGEYYFRRGALANMRRELVRL